jgi:WD40 repeat protein
VWDAQTGQELLTFEGNTGNVYSVAFSPDGKRLTSSWGPFGGVKVWDAQTGLQLLTLKGGGFGSSLAFSPDGHRLVSAEGSTTGGFTRARAVIIYDATPLPEKP